MNEWYFVVFTPVRKLDPGTRLPIPVGYGTRKIKSAKKNNNNNNNKKNKKNLVLREIAFSSKNQRHYSLIRTL